MFIILFSLHKQSRSRTVLLKSSVLGFCRDFRIIWFCGRCCGSEHSVFVPTICLFVCLSVCEPLLRISSLCHVTVGIITNVCVMSPKEKRNQTKLSGAVPVIVEGVKSAVCVKVCQYLYY